MMDPTGTGPPLAAPPPRRRMALSLATLTLVALGVGIGVWMLSRGDPRRSPTRPDWSFTAVEVEDVCGPGAEGTLLESLEPRDEPLPLRLTDHMLASSPVARYGLGFDGPVSDFTRPWQKAMALQGVLQGYARTFNSTTMAGGFTMYVYELPSVDAAKVGVGNAYRTFVCDFGAQPLRVAEQPKIFAGVRPSDSTVAWWVHEHRVVEVSYAMYGELERDLDIALVVLEDAWDAGSPGPPVAS